MNSSSGKEILAILRDGDFAHAGGLNAIEEVFKKISPDPCRKLLDVGCGRGGTAGYLQRNGFGKVAGFDIDLTSVSYAQDQYPEVSFRCLNILDCASSYGEIFDITFAFNVLYCLDPYQQEEALRQMAKLVSPGGMFIVFDYTSESVDEPFFHPLRPSEFAEVSGRLGWRVAQFADYSEKYRFWYSQLIRRCIERHHEISMKYGSERAESVQRTYAVLLERLNSGLLGGAAYYLVREDPVGTPQ